MELWIRSQDRTTLIRSYEIYIAVNKSSYVIRGEKTSHILGTYETYDRALEVLDEIQTLDIVNNPNIEVSYYAYSLIKVTYNMPKEQEGI